VKTSGMRTAAIAAVVLTIAGCASSPKGPSARALAATACSPNYMFVFGGWDFRLSTQIPRNDGWIYSYRDGTWGQIPPPPVKPLGMTAAWTDSQFIAVGAMTNHGATQADNGSASLDLHFTYNAATYDPQTGKWEQLPAAPIDGDGPIDLAIDGTGAVLAYPTGGGFSVLNAAIFNSGAWVPASRPPPLSTVAGLERGFLAVTDTAAFRYSPGTDAWENIIDLPEPFSSPIWAERLEDGTVAVVTDASFLVVDPTSRTARTAEPLNLAWIDSIRTGNGTVVAIDTFNGRLAATDDNLEWRYIDIPVVDTRQSSMCLNDNTVTVFGGEVQADPMTVHSTAELWILELP